MRSVSQSGIVTKDQGDIRCLSSDVRAYHGERVELKLVGQCHDRETVDHR